MPSSTRRSPKWHRRETDSVSIHFYNERASKQRSDEVPERTILKHGILTCLQCSPYVFFVALDRERNRRGLPPQQNWGQNLPDTAFIWFMAAATSESWESLPTRCLLEEAR